MKVAIVHEWLTNMAGSERCIVNFKEIYKDAPIYTTMYNPDKLDDELKNIDVRTSFLQRWVKKGHQRFLPFMPFAFENFDLSNYDVILSSNSCCSKGVITTSKSMHVCYCHTPMRYAWEFYHDYIDNSRMGKLKKIILRVFMNYMRIWDRLSADRVDYFIANSENVAKRIWKYYRRESVVIHPPVRCNLFNISNVDEDYFLVMSRLVGYKRIDLAVQAFNKLGLPLVVIGAGEELEKLKKMANDNITFLGRQPDDVIKEYYAKCRAFIFPGEEDFGITPLEAMASGRPVIAYGKGGALETVIEGKTGLFFKEQTIDDLIDAITKFENMKFDKNEIRKHAEKFDDSVYKEKIESFISEKFKEFYEEKKYKVIESDYSLKDKELEVV